MKHKAIFVSLGKKIKKVRISKNMTQESLAIKSGLEKAHISRIEAGLSNSTVLTLFRLSVALEVNMVDLFKD